MFSLHESTQRLLCRALFVLLAAVPAVLTVVWIAYSLRPWCEVDWQQAISEQLHVQVAVEQVDKPRPGLTQLKNVTLTDLRSGERLASLGLLEVRWENSRLMLEADEISLPARSFPALASTVSTALSATTLPPCRLKTPQLTIANSQRDDVTLGSFRFVTEQANKQSCRILAQAELPLDSHSSAGPTIKLLVEKQDATTSATLDTGGGRLPGWLLANLLPTLGDFAEATFAGAFRLEQTPRQTRGTLTGRFEQLDLSHWFAADNKRELAAVAEVAFEKLQWQDERIEVAHGNLLAADGRVSRSLLAELQQRLYCRPGAVGGQAEASAVEFDELACGFHLTATGLTLTGRCRTVSDGAPGCMLAAQGATILVEPEYSNLPVALLVQALAQPAATWLPSIPGSREANEMAGSLPLPRVGPQPDDPAGTEVASQPKDSTAR